MDSENVNFNQVFYQTLEKSIENLPQAIREALYRPCAESCMKRYVLKEQQRQFEECDSNLDLQYEKYGKTDYFFADIIEKGHIYDIGYPVSQCLCPMVASGMASSQAHCECSRQSMLYVLQTLMPEKNITVSIIHSVIMGANECRFRVIVE